MKPLTIKELKELKCGSWIWIVYIKLNEKYNEYIRKSPCSNEEKLYSSIDKCKDAETYLNYSDYGTIWLAWKNKEESEIEQFKIQYGKYNCFYVYSYQEGHYKWLPYKFETKEDAEQYIKDREKIIKENNNGSN